MIKVFLAFMFLIITIGLVSATAPEISIIFPVNGESNDIFSDFWQTNYGAGVIPIKVNVDLNSTITWKLNGTEFFGDSYQANGTMQQLYYSENETGGIISYFYNASYLDVSGGDVTWNLTVNATDRISGDNSSQVITFRTHITGGVSQYNITALDTPLGGLKLWYKFNENSGIITIDSSGSGNNGTITEAVFENDGINISNVNATINLTLTDLNNSLVYWANFTLINPRATGSLTIPFFFNQTLYALDFINITEGVQRLYSPFNFTAINTLLKNVTSSLLSSVNVTTIFSQTCASLNAFTINGINFTNYTCSSNTINAYSNINNGANNFSLGYASNGNGNNNNNNGQPSIVTTNSTGLQTTQANNICRDVKGFLSLHARDGNQLSEIPIGEIKTFITQTANKYGLPESMIKMFVYSYNSKCNDVYPIPPWTWLKAHGPPLLIVGGIVLIVLQTMKV